jgi:hypothetical protein
MEDAALSPSAGDLPPEYQAVVAAGYDEEALLQQVLEESKADEDERFPDLQQALTLTGMMAQHLASLPPPPPLPLHALLLVAYWGRRYRCRPAFHAGGVTTRTEWSSTAPAGGHRRPRLRRR